MRAVRRLCQEVAPGLIAAPHEPARKPSIDWPEPTTGLALCLQYCNLCNDPHRMAATNSAFLNINHHAGDKQALIHIDSPGRSVWGVICHDDQRQRCIRRVAVQHEAAVQGRHAEACSDGHETLITHRKLLLRIGKRWRGAASQIQHLMRRRQGTAGRARLLYPPAAPRRARSLPSAGSGRRSCLRPIALTCCHLSQHA